MNITETVREILADVVPEPSSRLEDQVLNTISEKYNEAQRAINICARHTPRNASLPRELCRTTMGYNIACTTTDHNDLKTIVEVGTAILIDNFIKHLSTATTSYNPACLNLWLSEAVEMNNLSNLETLNHLYITQQLNK